MEEHDVQWDAYDASSKLLRQAIEKLNERSRQAIQSDLGLSNAFRNKSRMTEELALKLCERAMDNLSGHYIENLTAFIEAEDPEVALEKLEESEVTWKSQTALIRHFDADNTEDNFFQEMRSKTHMVLEQKLKSAAEKTSKDASAKNIALCIGILAIIDSIYLEKGVSETAPVRKKLRDIVRGFV